MKPEAARGGGPDRIVRGSYREHSGRSISLEAAPGPAEKLIPLLAGEDIILRALDYYELDLVHFCELIPLAEEAKGLRKALCESLTAVQRRVRKEFPVQIIRSVPFHSRTRETQHRSGKRFWRLPNGSARRVTF